VLARRAAASGERPAYLFLADGEVEAESLTWGGLEARAQTIAAALAAQAAPGERALLLYPPGLEFVSAFFGCLRAGVVAVPAYPPRPRKDQPRLRAIVRDAEPRLALTTSDLLPGLEKLAAADPGLAGVRWLATDRLPAAEWDGPDPDPESVAFLQYTSGSTSTPKGVMVTHANLVHNEQLMSTAFEMDEESVVVGWLPLYHDMGLIGNVLQPLWCGGRCILMSPVAFLQRPRRWLEAVARYRATTSGGPNFSYDLCTRKVGPEEREGLDLSSWRVAYNGAEPVRAETLERFATAFAPAGFRREAFYPCYGLAEATLFVTGGRVGEPPRIGDFDAAALERHEVVEGDSRRLVSSGQSTEQRLIIADPETGVALPEERVGEIWVSGPSVALGYWKRPEVTEREMRAVLAGEEEGPRFLRTGDLGFLRDGELFVTGRLKDLIIIRGRNHYPQDLELTAERAHPDLRAGNAAAFAVDVEGEERLILALEVERRVRGDREILAEVAEAVRRAVAEEHEVQVAEVVLLKPGSLPKTSSGKVQRHACRAGYLDGTLEVVGTSGVGEVREAAPAEEGELDGSLVAFLADRVAALAGLGGRRPDPDVPLTALGLDSLAAVELKASVEGALGVEVSLADLLEGCSLRELAAGLEPLTPLAPLSHPLPHDRERGERIAGTSGPRGLGGGAPLPVGGEGMGEGTGVRGLLSVGQEALWFIERLAPSGGAYNIVVAARVSGELDAAALLRATERLTLRHDALRTTFHEVEGAPVRRIGGDPAVDWREMAGDDAELAAEGWAPFDLENGPLVRVRLFRQAGGERVLLLAIHHLVADFQSLAVLHRELDALYDDETGGPAVELPEARSDAEFIRWQRGMLAGPRGAELEAFWRQRLAGPPADLELPTDRPRPPVQTFRGGLRSLTIPPGPVERIAALGRAQGATLFATLLALWQAQLGRESGQEDFAVGAPTLGRSLPGMADVVGYFVSPVALRSELAGDPSFSALLERVRRSTAAALAHADYPLATLAEKLRPVRDPSRSPLFQAMLVLHAARPGDDAALGAFALGEPGARLGLGSAMLEPLRLPENRAQFDLTLRVAPVSGGGLGLLLEFNADLFDAATAERLLGHFQTLLDGAAAEPDARVSELPLLTEAERRQILGDWVGTGAVSLRHAALHEPFFERAEREPDAVALIAGEERLTCRELVERARQLARFLRRHGVGPEARVGVCLRRTPDLIAALLGVLEAGGAYVPLDPAYPAERLRFSLEDSGAEWLIAEGPPLPWPLPRGAGEGNPLPLSSGLCLFPLPCLSPLSRSAGEGASPENLAYLIYTSGSTGRPKGVAIEHRSALALIEQARLFTPEELSGVLASTSVCFDLSVFEIFVPLALGGRVILAENALALPALPAVGEVTLVNTVPSAMAELVRGGYLPPSVRAVVLAGEPLPGELARSIHQAGTVRLFNLYGPSEDTTYSTGTVIEQSADRPSIGRPLAGARAYVLDTVGTPVPVGVPGELLLGGPGLARGYLGRPELTAERFVPDPFEGGGERLYRTGDLVRWKASGDLDFLGRIDHQVKIRGFRVEPGEIEAVLRELPGVRDAAVVVQRGGVAGPRLAAFVVPEETAEEPEVWRRALRARLPEFMVPAVWEILPELPRMPNGKVDRRALAGRVARPEPSKGAAPATLSEELLAALWAEVLGLERVGRDAHFFELGGHSLLAVRLLARVRSVLGADLPLEELFRAPTPAALAERLRARGEGTDREPIPRRPWTAEASPPPASSAQERFWMLERLAPGEPTYHLPGAVRLHGRLDVAALASALSAVVVRHEALRTVFREAPHPPGPPLPSPPAPPGEGGTLVQTGLGSPLPVGWEGMGEGLGVRGCDLVQMVRPAASVPLPEIDLSTLPEEAREAEARRLTAAEARRPFDLAAGPLVRAGLARLGSEEWLLWLVLHHAAGDGGSLEILVREVAAFYRGDILPELPIQIADFAVWERERLRGERLASLLAFWRERLTGVSPLELPYDRPRPAVPSFRGGTIPLPLPDLDALTRRSGTTRFMVLLAGLDALLARITGQTDVTVGIPVSLRTRVETEALIGPLINTLAVRVSCAGDPAIPELLSRVRRATLEAHAHQELPFEGLESSFLQTMLAPQDAALAFDLPGIEAVPVPVDTGTAKLDLTLLADERQPSARLEYSADLFDASTAARLAAWLETLLAGLAAAEEGTRLSDLPLLSAAERHQLLITWNDTAAPFPADCCVHHLFERQAARTPEAVAVEQEGISWTYRELERRAERLARRLRSAGAGPDTIVGLCAERSPEMVGGLLGILKAGAAYLPLEPDAGQPPERLAFLLDDARAALVLGSRTGLELLTRGGELKLPSILLEEDGLAESSVPPPALSPDSLAYVLYTSGSTGRPKGVMVPHRGVVNYLAWAVAAYLRAGSLDAPLHSPLGADLSVTSLFAPLLAGGTVKLLSPGAGVEGLVEAVRVGRFGLLKLTPAHLAILGHALADRELTGRAGTLVIGGEALLGESLALWREKAPATLVVNEYGPTETVVGCAVHAAAAGELPAGPVPIGRPIANARLYVVDAWMQPVGVGIAGELLIGGAGVARGYLSRPDLTAERFVPDAFGGFGGRLYRTGDLVRFRADGILEFLGRNDLQIKLRGHRIEPGEIEGALLEHPAVRQAAVGLRGEGEERHLVSWVVLAEEAGEDELRAFLGRRLPAFMIPALFVPLPELPLSPNGKVDRGLLPEPGEPRRGPAHFDPPRTVEEEILAEVWAEVLRRERIGRQDRFTELGGSSLQAVRAAARISRTLGVQLPVSALLQEPLAVLASRLDRRARVHPVVPVPRGGDLPLSAAQSRMWFLDRLHPGTAAYHLAGEVWLRGRLEPGALAAALEGVVRRHEALRTAFPERPEGPVQEIRAAAGVPLPVIDLSHLLDGAAEADRLVAAEARRPFDLTHPPLLRATLLRLGAEEHRLALVLHHIVADGWSLALLLRELGASYGSEELPEPPPLQLADFAVAEREWIAAGRLAEQESFWRERLAGDLPALDLPADFLRPRKIGFRGLARTRDLPAELAASLEQAGRGRGATLFMTLLAGFAVLLSRTASQEDLVIGAPVANRNHPDSQGVIGCFVNTLPLRLDLAGSPSFAELLDRVRAVCLAAYARQELPLERIVEIVRPAGRETGRSPLFQAILVLDEEALVPRFPGLETGLARLDTGTAKVDLSLHVTSRAAERSAAGLGLVLEAAADLFRAETAERLLGHFQALLAGAAADPGARLSDLPLLTAEERVQIVEWNAAGSLPLRQSLRHRGLHEPFLERAARDPGAEVLIAGEERRTAGELAARVHRLARLLRELGVEPEARVAVCLRREPDLIASLLAVLAAGGAYVPLDPAYPRERLSFYLEDSGARWLIVDADTAGLVDASSCQEIHLDRDAGEIARRSAAPPASVSTPDHLAYLIYTSGSTGRPKGVAIEHRSALALIEWARGFFPPAELAGMLAATSVCFDLSVFEIFVPLSLGGRVILAENALALPGLPAASEVTFINTVPSAMAELLRGRSVPGSVRAVALAGEPLPGDLARRIHELPGLRRLLNLYGPSEDTTYSTWAVVEPGEPRPPIGRPVAGSRAWVLDAAGGLVPVGVPGELFLAGAGLARGYLGRPELTAERFVPDGFCGFGGGEGERLYRTGDLVRRRPDGSLDFLGRTDHQVKIRGFRIELGEIEARLAGHPEVAEAVVLAWGDPQAGVRLAAWVVPRSGSGLPRGLREWLRERLPEHMVPSLWTVLPALPRTANGKVDRRALPAPAALTAAAGGEEASARNPLEEILATLFAEVLGLGRAEVLGGDASFFDAGGHSLLVTRLVARIRQTLGVDLPLTAVFQAPTVTGLARRVEEALSRGGARRPGPIPRIPRAGDSGFPASFAQERLWFLDQLEPGEATYHMPAAVRLRGPLNVAALHGALSGAVLRHEALRTLFEATPDGPVQVILPPAPVPLPEIDLSTLAADRFEAEALRLAAAEARRPFDLATGPLLRAALVRLAADEHRLLFNLHHVAADGGSMAVLLRDVGALYRAALTGGDPGLPALPIQYADFAVWQRERMRRERLAALLAFWRGQLAGAPPAIELPADRPVPVERTRRGGTVPFALSEELSRELATLARRRGATRFMVLLAGLDALLARLSGQSDLVVGIPVSGRTRIETEELVGLFVNTLPLRVDCGGCLSALDLIGRVRRALLEAYAHQELPFEQLVNALRTERDLGRSPLFQVMLAPRGAEMALDLPEIVAELLPVDTGTFRFDLTFLLGEETPVGGTLEYSADLFDAVTAARLAGWWRTLLEGMAAAGEEDLLAGLPLLDAAERSQLLATGDGGPRPVEEDVGLHELFARQAAASPDAVALVHGELQVTYGELAARAAQLAKILRGLSVGPEVPVGVCAQRTPDLIAALLGVLAAGGCYLPLDPGYPPERLALMLEDAGAPVVLLEEGLRDRLPEGAARLVFLESVGHGGTAILPRGEGLPGNLAYLIYTSGSTGRPKGVAIEHRSAVALVRWARGVFAPEELSGVLASTSVCFDLSVFEIFVPLSLGGRVILAENAMELPTLPAAPEVTLVNTVPSAMAALAALDGLPPSVRTVNLAGEPLPRQLVQALHAAGAERVLDLYGPSEDTTYSTFAQINPAAAGAPEIGRPIEGTRAYVVDAASHLLPSGVPGELLLGGAGLARGYLRRPDLTAERFVPDPYSGDPGGRLYRTGDLVRWRSDRSLDFLGRIDHQVKVRGFRIELGEVEAVLARHPEVRQAAVVARGEGEDRRLVAYVAAGDGSAESGRHVLEALYTDMDISLPAYMVPAAVVVLESLPLTPNGKVDRRALPAPEAPARERDVFVPPRTSTEEMVAEIWAEVLGIERVGLGRSFFDLGGHSLRAAAVVARIRERFGLNVPLRELFVASTVEGVAARIEEELLRRASDDQLDELLALLDAEEDGAGGG
jgi:amino acid adenylation domain-containing protein